MSSRVKRLAAALAALALVGAATSAVAQTGPADSTAFQIGSAKLIIRAHPSGYIHIDAVQRGRHVAAWFSAADLTEWAERAVLLLDAESAGELGGYIDRKRRRVEYKTPLLFATNLSGMIFDRVERDGDAVLSLFLSRRDGTHMVYLPMTRSGAASVLEALRGASVVALRMGGEAVASAR